MFCVDVPILGQECTPALGTCNFGSIGACAGEIMDVVSACGPIGGGDFSNVFGCIGSLTGAGDCAGCACKVVTCLTGTDGCEAKV